MELCCLNFMASEQLTTLIALQYSQGIGRSWRNIWKLFLVKDLDASFNICVAETSRDLVVLEAITGEKLGPYSKHPQSMSHLSTMSTFSCDNAGSWDLAAIKSKVSGLFCIGLGLGSIYGTGNCFKYHHLTGLSGTL